MTVPEVAAPHGMLDKATRQTNKLERFMGNFRSGPNRILLQCSHNVNTNKQAWNLRHFRAKAGLWTEGILAILDLPSEMRIRSRDS